MKGLVLHGKHDLRYQTMDDPAIEDTRDIVVKTVACGICGSDLHLFHGEMPNVLASKGGDLEPFCIGHEAVGEVVEAGRNAVGVKVGDKVIVPAAVGCGQCRSCLMGDIKRCETGNLDVFGCGTGLPGCQAEYVRVPVGDFNALRLSEGVTVDQGILLTDNLPTAFAAVKGVNVGPGKSVAVVGLGPIGLMAVELSLMMGAAVVFAVDPVVERRAIARSIGATPVDEIDIAGWVAEQTGGRMVDCVIEAAGSDRAMETCFDLAGVGAGIGVLAVNSTPRYTVPFASCIKGVRLNINFFTEVNKYWDELVPLLEHGKIRPQQFITDRSALEDGAAAYKKFGAREGGTLKTVLYPN